MDHPQADVTAISRGGAAATRGEATSANSVAAAVYPRGWWGSRLIAFLTIAGLGAAADLYSKQAVFQWRGLPGEEPVYWVWENYAGIQTAVNPGALFGLGAGWGSLFAVFSIAAAIAIGVWLFGYRGAYSWWLTIAAAFILGGIAGNLYDRLGLWYEPWMQPEWRSGVRDWILLCYREYTWPNFNIADSLLVCGTAMLLCHSFFAGEQKPVLTPTASASP